MVTYDYDVLAARINKSADLVRECNEIYEAILNYRKHISKSRVRKLQSYRLFFETIRSEPILTQLADWALQLIDENIELVAIYNATGDSEVSRQKALWISKLMEKQEEIMKEIKRKVG